MHRRRFLQSGCVGSVSLLSTYSSLALANARLAVEQTEADNYKALVCIFLSGGNDSFNMLLPASPGEYRDYAATRGGLAIPLQGKSSAIHLAAGVGGAGRDFAVHPACSGLASLYATRSLAFVSNVGTLVEPTTVSDYKKGSKKHPPSLFSHNDQREQWQTGVPGQRVRNGWLGRTADLIDSGAGRGDFSMNISLSGNNLIQTGKLVTPFSISPEGAVKLRSSLAREMFAVERGEKSNAGANLFEETFQESLNQSVSRNESFSSVFNQTTTDTKFPDSSLSKSLKTVARTIAAREKLGKKRQTFFVIQPGWDTHQEQPEKHGMLLKELNDGIVAFQDSMQSMNLSDSVTTFTASDFGRTLRTNGRGTDHGWGGNCFVVGGAVNGGRILGDYPETLRLGAGADIGKSGRLLPGLSCDEYFASLLAWFGLSGTQLLDVLPSLNRFVDVSNPSELPKIMM